MPRKRTDLPKGDDGRTIADMNVEGMPWYTPGARPRRVGEKNEEGTPQYPPGAQPRRGGDREGLAGPALSREESRLYTWGALKAALLVVGVLCAGIILFVLFCTEIWFR